MATRNQPDPKPDRGVPAAKVNPQAPRPGAANKPAGQPASKGPLVKPRTS